jgi:RHS repeat-associated protein
MTNINARHHVPVGASINYKSKMGVFCCIGASLGLLAGIGSAHASKVTGAEVYTSVKGVLADKADVQSTIVVRPDHHQNSPIPTSGFAYTRIRYYDLETSHFLSVDPKKPQAGNIFNVNRYAYADDNPINKFDPTGAASWLVARPTPFSSGPAHHMFVVVAPSLGAKPVARFSYGPSQKFSITASHAWGSLVEQNGSHTGTDNTDRDTWNSLASSSADSGVHVVQINASDAAVISSGTAIDQKLGSTTNPGSVIYAPVENSMSSSNTANSNSAAIAVANGALGNGQQQPLPENTHPIGWEQSDHVTNAQGSTAPQSTQSGGGCASTQSVGCPGS